MKTNNLFYSHQRLKQKKEFQYLFKKGFRIYGGSFIYCVVFSKEKYSKIGISISKKFGNAVYRNTIKRYFREIFRTHHFPYHITILVYQTKPFSKQINLRQQIKKAFYLMSDYYVLLQGSVDSLSIKTNQVSSKMSVLSKVAFYIIYTYRRFLSPNLLARCRFTPSCSVYALEALRMHSFVKSCYLIIIRLISCHPWGSKGYDPVPKSFHKKK